MTQRTSSPSSRANDVRAFIDLLTRHLDEEEAWLHAALERFRQIQQALAAYDLNAVAHLLEGQRNDEATAATMRNRRAAIRKVLAQALDVDVEQATLGRLVSRLEPIDRENIQQRRQRLLPLGRQVAAAQAATQRLILHVHGMSQMFLSQLFGETRDTARYGADGSLARRDRGSLLEVRT